MTLVSLQFWALGSVCSMHKELDLEVLEFGKMCKNGWYQRVGAFFVVFLGWGIDFLHQPMMARKLHVISLRTRSIRWDSQGARNCTRRGPQRTRHFLTQDLSEKQNLERTPKYTTVLFDPRFFPEKKKKKKKDSLMLALKEGVHQLH
jgi:hypothetical protein